MEKNCKNPHEEKGKDQSLTLFGWLIGALKSVLLHRRGVVIRLNSHYPGVAPQASRASAGCMVQRTAGVDVAKPRPVLRSHSALPNPPSGCEGCELS